MSSSNAPNCNPSTEADAIMGLFSLVLNKAAVKTTNTTSSAGGDKQQAAPRPRPVTINTNGNVVAHRHVQSASASWGTTPTVPTIVPGVNDILSGRGNGANQHSGNIYFRNLIASYRRRYVISGAVVKKQITSQAFVIVQSRVPPGRFLKFDMKTGIWTELDQDAALKKTAQALREKAPQLKKKFLEEDANNKEEDTTRKRKEIDPADPTLPAAGQTASRESEASQNKNSKQHNSNFLNRPIQHYQDTTQQSAGLASIQRGPAKSRPQQILPTNHTRQGQQLPHRAYHATSQNLMNASVVDNGNGGAFLGQQSIRSITKEPKQHLPFTFNYKFMTISSHKVPSASKKSTPSKKRKDNDEQANEALKNISVVASTSCDLTALYFIIRMSCKAFCSSSAFARGIIAPRPCDVLSDANAIHNHPGNVTLAESVQSYRSEYLQSRGSQQVKEGIAQLVYAAISKESDAKASAEPGRFLIHGKKRDSVSWKVLTAEETYPLIRSLLDQACSYILNPDANDILFGGDDRTRLSPGNILFRSIIKRCKPLFLQSPPEKRNQYAAEIVGFITSRPGRFLGYLPDIGMWTPLPFEAAIQKTREDLLNTNAEAVLHHASHQNTHADELIQATNQSFRVQRNRPVSQQVPPQPCVNDMSQLPALRAASNVIMEAAAATPKPNGPRSVGAGELVAMNGVNREVPRSGAEQATSMRYPDAAQQASSNVALQPMGTPSK
jgi:hypothetical protein